MRHPPGVIVANVGHSNREIDVAWLDRKSRHAVRRGIDRHMLEHGDVSVVSRGSLVSLAQGAGIALDEIFYPFAP